ncbi:hypothetical protein PHYPSEUDO_010044 [Phytophthora pseudosyringae]|uniref:TOG domain-containing protein n=1 Tax=Phytophthora pseudosyringae TaxID=221518 RepID=A0A8T1W804_9STRA|nr:hypothetical protein PHYPSEUDO_010044 [Phytophthora pseudosyringae]
METSVDTLVYQLEDDDTNVRWKTLEKLRKIAAVETSHFPVRNTRRFLQCVRRRIVGEADLNVAVEALRLLGDVMISLGDSVDQILTSILPHLIPILPKKRKNDEQDGDSDEEADSLYEEMFQVFRKYTNVTNDLQAVADLLVNIGLGSGKGSVREASLIVLMRLLDERFLKRTMTRSAIGRGDKALIVALVQAIIPALEDANEKVVVAAEEAIAKLESYWGSRFSTDVMKFLSSEDKQTLKEHQDPIADFLQVCTASASPPASPSQPPRPISATSSSSDLREELSSAATARPSPSKVHPLDLTADLRFGFLKASIVSTLTTNTSNSNADWKKRAAAVEKLYAASKEVDEAALRGLTAEERAKRMDELEELFDILVRLTQDVDVHLVKRALQITQILFRKLSPPRQLYTDDTQNEHDDEDKESDDRHSRSRSQKDAAFYMTKMLAPMIETAANFAGDDDEMESFVYTLLGQVFESGCVSVTSIEQVLAATSLRHRRSQVREETAKVWLVLLLIADRGGLLSANYAPNEFVVQTLGRLLGDTSARVRDVAFEVAAVLAMVCCCNIYALLETFIDDEYVSERVDWAALRARLRRKQVPELRSNCTLRIKSTVNGRNGSTSRSGRLSSSVEQSLDGVSELKMMVANNGLKSSENRRHDTLTNEPVKGNVITEGNCSDRPYFDQEETGVDGGGASCSSVSEEGPTTVDINDKLCALRKKMDQLRQPRTNRVRRPNSQEKMLTTAKSARGHDHTTDPKLPRSKSSPEQSTNNAADDIDAPIQSKEETFRQPPRDKRVHPNRMAVALPTPEAFTSSPRQPAELSPQQLQSLQSDARNYEDRPLKSKFIGRQRELENDAESLSPTQTSPVERPIRPMATAGDPPHIDLNFVDHESPREFDNNDTRSTRTNNGERVVSLATRKRLEAKAKQDAQASPTTERVRARENNTPTSRKKPAKAKGAVDDLDTKARPSGKQEPRYLEVHEIAPLLNPKQDLSKALSQLRSDDWEANFDALSTVRRLATHHAGLLDTGKVHAIVSEILKQIPNLRSSVSKNALLALESMCAAFSRTMDSEVENIIPVLLKRCTDSNAFVCESAASSLHAVILKCSTSRVVAALGSLVSSKAAPIRREVARGIHAVIAGQADNIQASKDLPSILQLVGRCLEDSNNEVRDVAKQSVMYLHYTQRVSGERIKRFLSVSAQTKVDGVLSGKVAYAPPVFPTPRNVSDVASDCSSSPLAPTKKREPPAVPPRTKKTTKQPSTRTSPPPSSSGSRSTKINPAEMLRLETKLGSSNWKDRFDALTETTDFICGCASALADSGQMLNLFDQLIKRLDDGNAKVNVLALECMEKIVPAMGSGMEQVLPNFVPAITKNLANARTASLAQSVVQQLCAHTDSRPLCQQLAAQARSANSRVVPVLLDTLSQLAAQSVDDKGSHVLSRHVLPLALDLLKEAKSGVRDANSRLLQQLRRTLGPVAVSSAASKLSSAQQDKLAAVLR